ncbi:hypothetical protein [Amphibacillus cookii]|uniref:hypothetical protein n=1 Tax=Amphibacillus cookii TaxID=767787 RepID=UPI001957FC6D|nr:hypothetical protein [Amphibacillus cookii]MBM7540488.1 hypothetical protein [Amphibacillus cookii]
MKKMIAFIGLFFLLLGGCQMNQDVRPKDIDPEDLPDVPAFQDEATREFLVSTEEVDPGFYLMESKLEGFQMLLPENGVYSKLTSAISNQDIETFSFESRNDSIDIHVIGQVKYHRNQAYLADSNDMLVVIRERTGYDGEFKKKESQDKNIYYGEELKALEVNNNSSDIYSYHGYIESKEEDFLAIDYNFSIFCFSDDNEICLKEINAKQKQVEKIIDSITFINQEEADRDD